MGQIREKSLGRKMGARIVVERLFRGRRQLLRRLLFGISAVAAKNPGNFVTLVLHCLQFLGSKR